MGSAILLDRIDHIVLDTADIARSLEFYSRLPGIFTSMEKGRGVAILGQQKLNIHIYPPVLSPVAASPVIGSQEYCLEASGSTESWTALLSELAIESEILPDHRENGFYIHDPDNNRIHIKLAEIEQDMKPRITGLSELILLVNDLAPSLMFYGQTLGMPIREEERGAACGLKYGCLRLVKSSSTLKKGSGDFCLIAEDDVTRLYSEMTDAPFVQDMGIVRRTGALGPIRSFYLRDPDGNLVEISNYLGKL